jgi:L-asparaginase
MYAGADGSYVRHAADTGAEAIVVEAYGWGNVNEAMHDAIKYAIDKGVPVVVATKVYNGRTLPVYGFQGWWQYAPEGRRVFAGDLSGDKARLLTMLALPATKEQKRLQEYFDK